jgi:hypothetical protein
MTRRIALAASSLALLAVGACADMPSAPAAPIDTPTDAPALAVTAGASDTSRVSFSYGPGTSVTVRIGAHKIALPTNAVCDPATSGYGPGTWDTACVPLAKYMTFQVKAWTDAQGHPRIRFSPDVRFVPTKTVNLYLYDRAAVADPAFRFMWCPTGATTCVDESRTDASLLPKRDASGGFLWGRIKHFSGYNVVVDRAGDGTSLDGM